MSSCSKTIDIKTISGKTFEIVNSSDIFGSSNRVDYVLYEFLEENRFISECRFDSIIILQQGSWDILDYNRNKFLVLSEIKGKLDTFKIIQNLNVLEFKCLNAINDTLCFKQVNEANNFEPDLLIDKNWLSINDSIFIGLDSFSNNPIYRNIEIYFNSDKTYVSNNKPGFIGNWRFNKNKNRIILDSLLYNDDIIKIEKVSKDSLFIWRRDLSKEPKRQIFIKNN